MLVGLPSLELTSTVLFSPFIQAASILGLKGLVSLQYIQLQWQPIHSSTSNCNGNQCTQVRLNCNHNQYTPIHPNCNGNQYATVHSSYNGNQCIPVHPSAMATNTLDILTTVATNTLQCIQLKQQPIHSSTSSYKTNQYTYQKLPWIKQLVWSRDWKSKTHPSLGFTAIAMGWNCLEEMSVFL